MALLRTLLRVIGVTALAGRGLVRGGVRTGRFVGRNVSGARRRGGVGEAGMMRLLDLHAASCAGDTLIAIGLAGTVFFAVPVGEARGRVALYLLVTMLPFAVLAPVIGPLLDRVRHGRRYALAATFLGRGLLAYVISDHHDAIALYPAAFGILVLSRAYGVARSAAVPRLLPPGLGLSEAGARAAVFGTLAGAAVVPVGLIAFAFGPQWPLRVALLVFLFGMVTALRLPPRADSDPPETVPRLFQLPGRKGVKVLPGRLAIAVVAGSATLRALYGFLALFLAFSIRARDLPTVLFGRPLADTAALGLVVAALGAGSFLATAVGTTVRIRRPLLLQAVGITVTAVAGGLAIVRYALAPVALLCLLTAVASGLAKLAVDAVVQERTDDDNRASAFAHTETLLMIAWVAGGALGLIPLSGRLGLTVATAALALGAGRAIWVAVRLRGERLRGTPLDVSTKAMERPAGGKPARTPSTRAAPPADLATKRPPETTQPMRTKVLPEAPVSPAPRAQVPDDDSPGFHLYRPSSSTDDPR
jgi:MFS family permease